MKPITDTFQINNCDTYPLMVNATLSVQKEDEGWTWEVENINWIELQINAGKESIGITSRILNNPRAKAMIVSAVEDCDTQIMESIAHHKAVA
jgi:hypothetical protein